MRNIQSLKAKQQAHQVTACQAQEHTWTVLSGTSGSTYAVRLVDGVYRCECHYDRYTKRGQNCSCSHVTAVLAHEAAEEGRRLVLHDNQEAAARSKRPVVDLGNGLFASRRLVTA